MSHRGDMTERIVRIPLLLLERPRSQQELAAEFAVDGVTIRRDITQLSRFYAISAERHGREISYHFSGNYQFKQPNFTAAELATLLLAQQSIVATGANTFGTPFAGYGRTLLEKVRAALPSSLREYLDALANIFGTAAIPAKDFTPHAETIDRLTKAAAARRRVRLRYQSLNSREINEREFDPYAVYFDPDGATLKTIGFDHRRREIRLFSIDHIERLTEINIEFTRPPDFDLQSYLSANCFNGIHDAPLTVRLKAYDVTARVFAERQFHPSQRIVERTPPTPSSDETTTIEMTVARGRGLERFILSWMPQVEVLDPPELRERIVDDLRRGSARNGAA